MCVTSFMRVVPVSFTKLKLTSVSVNSNTINPGDNNKNI